MANKQLGSLTFPGLPDTYTMPIGTLSDLTTSAKGNLVAAINEVDADTDRAVKRSGTLADGTNIDEIFEQGIYALSGSNTYSGLPTGATYGCLIVFRPSTATSSTFTVQILISGSTTSLYYRLYGLSAWYNWRTLQGS